MEEKPLKIELVEDEDSRHELTAMKELDVCSFNTANEPRFLQLICRLLDDGELSVRAAVIEAAYELNISPETAKRYLSKHSARRARFSLEGGVVSCKIHSHNSRSL